jgi:flagellar biogenesis protein FliO
MFANLKSSAGDKVSGFMAAFNQGGSWSNKLKSLTGSADIGKMLGSLALVLGIYFAFVWVMRKINPNGGRGLPPEVIEVLGQVPFGARRSLQLVRLGSKLLLLMNSPEGTQPIGEITDPTEVEYLASLCPGKNKKRSNSVGMIGSGTSGSTNQGSTNQGSSNHIAAIQQAARNLVAPNNASTNAGASTTADSSTNSSNLANILRTLEQAAKPNGTVFEA